MPKEEQYGLVSQINRCAVSIPANIAERASRKTSTEFARFLDIALGSSFELETYFRIVTDLSMVPEELIHDLCNELNIIQKRMNELQ